MNEMRDAGRDLLRAVTRIRPGRGGKGRLLDEVAEIEVALRAATSSKQRIGGVLVANVAVEVAALRIHSFEDRPAKIHAGTNADVQVLPGIPADIADIKHTGIAIGTVVTAGARTQGDAARISQTERPNAGRSRARLEGIVKWIAGHTIAGGGIEPENLAV